MNWRRNSKPASADQLRTNAEPIRAEIERLRTAISEIPSALPDLAGDPEASAAAQAELREAQALLPVKEAALAAIEAAIPAAREREQREAFRAEVAAQRARDAKLKRNVRERFDDAAHTLSVVLAELEANAEEWRQLNARAQIMGEPVGEDVERELRKDLPINARGWSRIWADLDVRAWDGSLLFEGRPNAQRFA